MDEFSETSRQVRVSNKPPQPVPKSPNFNPTRIQPPPPNRHCQDTHTANFQSFIRPLSSYSPPRHSARPSAILPAVCHSARPPVILSKAKNPTLGGKTLPYTQGVNCLSPCPPARHSEQSEESHHGQ